MAVNAPLTIRFASDTSAAKSGMQDLAASVVSNGVRIVSGLKGAVDTFEGLAGQAANLNRLASGVASLAAPVGMAAIAFVALNTVIQATTAAAQAAQERLDGLVKIATQATAAGVGTTFFQGLTGQAKELNVETSTLIQMLNTARTASTMHVGSVDADGTVSGRSSAMQDALERQRRAGNIGADAVGRFNGAETQEARIRVILDLVEELRRKGMDLAAFDIGAKMFGPDFEAQLRNGSDIIDRMRTSLDGMTASGGNRVISPEEIANAQAINAELQRARDIMADALKPLNEDIASFQQTQARAVADMNVQLAEAVGYAMRLYGLFQGMNSALTSIGNWSGWTTLRNALGSTFDKDGGGLPLSPAPDAAGPTLPAITVGPGDRSKALPSLRPAKAAGGGATETDPVQSYIDQLAKSTAALEAEAGAYGKSNIEKQKAIDLAKAAAIAEANGTTLTDAQTAKITELATKTGQLKDQMADVAQKARENAEALRAFGAAGTTALSDLIFNGKSADEVFKNLAKTIANQALQALMTGQGPLGGFLGMSSPASAGPNATGGLAGLLSSVFSSGGGRASGGPMEAGKTYTVGEMGREQITMTGNGWATPAGGSGGFGGGGGGVTVIDQRTAASPPAQVSRGPGGSTQIVLRDAEAGLAKRAYGGQGPLAPALSSPGMRRG